MKETRDYILKKTFELFLQKSYKEVTMKEIVDRTGLSKGAFYHYFESKDAVFVEVVKYFYNDIMITDYSDFPHTSLKDFYNAYIAKLHDSSDAEDDATKDDTNLFMFISEAARKIPNFSEIHINQRKIELDSWSDAVKRAKLSNEIQSGLSDQDIAKMFIYLSDGVSLTAITNKHNEDTLSDLRKSWDSLYYLLTRF